MPASTLRGVEIERHRLGRSRSSVVAEALEAWLRARGAVDVDRRYVSAYERYPEPAAAAVAAAAVAGWSSWDDSPAAGRRAPRSPSGRAGKRRP